MSLATRPKPAVDNWNREFWEACKRKELRLQRCTQTGKCFFPPAPVSPFTGRPEWEWITASGKGELWSYVVFHQSYFPGMKDELPYPVAMVKLDEGPFLLTNLWDMKTEEARIGMRLAVRFPGGPEGFLLPQFGPEGDGMSNVLVTRHDGWAEVRLNRESKRNAVDRATRQAMLDAFAALRGEARAIVITGTGKAFCAGMDLKEREQDREAGIEGAGDEWVAVNVAIREHPAIFIAAVNGLALGGGATMINVCDLAVASTEASIGCPEMGFATYPGMAGPAIQLSGVTRKQAAWVVLTTNRIDGATAERWGMVNECVAPDRLLPRAAEIAQQIARFDAVALAESKKALDRIPAFITDFAEAMDHGQMVNLTIRSKTKAQAEGNQRFAAGIKNPGQGV